MQVILIDDVYELGKRGEVVDVAKGYGRNFLIPNQMAIPATAGNIRQVEQRKQAMAKKEARDREEAELLAKELDKIHIVASRKAGETGSLFGSVTSKDIAELLKREGIHLDKRKLVIEMPLKSIGNYQIGARLHPGVDATILVSVVAEGDVPVSQVKEKDAESDKIVATLNEKVRELALPNEDELVLEKRFGPEPGEESEEEAAQQQDAPPADAAPEDPEKEDE